jgi:hypothetical protein
VSWASRQIEAGQSRFSKEVCLASFETWISVVCSVPALLEEIAFVSEAENWWWARHLEGRRMTILYRFLARGVLKEETVVRERLSLA